MGRHAAPPEPFTLGTRVLYGAESFKLDIEAADLDVLANTFMRAPGEAVGTFAVNRLEEEARIGQGSPQESAFRVR